MEEKQINKWLRRRFTVVGWFLVAYYVLMNVMAIVSMLTNSVALAFRAFASGDYSGYIDTDVLMGDAWGYVATVAVGLLILLTWKGGDYWNNEIRAKNQKMTGLTFFWLLSLTIGVQMANSLWVTFLEFILNLFGKSALALLESVSGDSDTFSMFLYASILAPISEEIIFRGFVLRSLKPFGKRFAIFGSAFLFGLFHGNLLQTPYAFLVGLVLGYTAVEYSIFWAIVLHTFNNLVLADLMTRFLRPLPTPIADAISLAVIGGFALVSVILLAVKHRSIRDYQRSEWMDRRCIKCFFGCSGVIVLMILMGLNMLSLLVM